jgi:hypothetical protein
MVSSMAAIGLAIGVATIAFGQLKDAMKQASEEQTAYTKLGNILKVTGSYSQGAMDDFKNFANEIKRTQGVEDEQVISLISLGKQLGLTNDQVKGVTTAAIKLSAATGQDLQSSFIQINATFEGSVGKLAKIVKGSKDLTEEQLRSGAVANLINKNFADNSALMDTAAGKALKMGMAVDDLKKVFGKAVIENKTFMDVVGKTTIAIQLFIDNLEKNEGKVAKIINYFGSGLASGFTAILDAVTTSPLEKVNAEILETEKKINDMKKAMKGDRSLKSYIFGGEELDADPLTLANNILITKKHLEELKKTYKDLATHKTAASTAGTNGTTGGTNPVVIESKLTPEQVKINGEIEANYNKNQMLEEEDARYNVDKATNIKNAADEEYAFENDIKSQELQTEADHQQALLDIQFQSDMATAQLITDSFQRRKAESDAYDKWELEGEKNVNKSKNDLAKASKDYEKSTNEERKKNMASTLGSIATLMQSSSEELFMIGKSSALAQATIDGIAAIQVALRSAPPPFNFALAALVGVAQAQNLVRIGETKMQKKEFGGIIDGTVTGDQTLVAANGGEIVLSKHMQSNLVNQLNTGSFGGNGSNELLLDVRNILSEKNFSVDLDGERLNKKMTDISNRRLVG